VERKMKYTAPPTSTNVLATNAIPTAITQVNQQGKQEQVRPHRAGIESIY